MTGHVCMELKIGQEPWGVWGRALLAGLQAAPRVEPLSKFWKTHLDFLQNSHMLWGIL